MCHFNRARMSGHTSATHPGWSRFAKSYGNWFVPVNVKDNKDWYEIHVYAPGLSKDAFQVTVTGDILSIRFEHGQQNEQSDWLHQEYARQPFERQFQLNGKVDTAGISARYTDGVLELTLPKLPGAAGHEVPVA